MHLVESVVRSTLFEGMLGVGKGPNLPKNGEILSVRSGKQIKKMRVSGVEYDTTNESFIINGMIDERPTSVFPEQIVEENLPGGLADGKTLEDISKMHGVSLDKIKKEFEMGIKVEMEHTHDKKLSREIAMDHLVEIPDYYTRLEKMEKEAKKEFKESVEHLEGISPEKWMKTVKRIDLNRLSPDELDEIKSQALEVEQYLRRKADSADNVRVASRYFNDVIWLEDNLFNESVLLERTRKPPKIMYHGTTDKFAQGILSQGLVPDAKEGKWKDDPHASYRQRSRESIPGSIYLTDNILTAQSSATNVTEKLGGNSLLVVTQVSLGSALADEDNIVYSIDTEFSRVLSKVGFGSWDERIMSYMGYFIGNKNDFKKARESFISSVHKNLAREKHIEPPVKTLELYFNNLLQRTAAYFIKEFGEDKHETRWAFIEAYQRGIKYDPNRTKQELDDMSNKAYQSYLKGLKEPKEYDKNLLKLLDKLTRTYTKTAREEQGFSDNIRIDTPITYSGRNKILAVLRVKEKLIEVLYGEIPEQFKSDWSSRMGSWENVEIKEKK